jgi:dihydroorotase
LIGSEEERSCDIGISAGRIEALGSPGSLGPAKVNRDAEGLTAIPGLVDAHVHLREPGLVHKEGFQSGTLAAAAGGVTTVMVMPTDDPVTMTPEHFEDKLRLAQGQCHVDYALQACVGPDPRHISELVSKGAVSLEIFLADVPETFLLSDAQSLLSVLEVVNAHGAIAGITPGDHSVVAARTAAIRARSSGAREDFPPTRPPISEALGVARACIAARETGARIHLRQLSCAQGLEAFEALRPLARITAEITPHNLLLDAQLLIERGPIAKVAPPLRPAADVHAMRKALRRKAIDIIATDHAPHLPTEKAAGDQDIWKAPGGLPGLQTFLAAMLHLVDLGEWTLQDLVRCCCQRPAEIFRLSRKGRIAPGFDADIVLLDLKRPHTVRDQDQLSKAAQTPFAGLRVQGYPVSVILRGIEIARDGAPVGRALGEFCRPPISR